AVGVLSGIPLKAEQTSRNGLWYGQPAERWLEALPLGNGHLGAMLYGGISTERIALSASAAWSGAPETGEVNPGALPHLNEIRQLFFSGRYDEAQALCGKYLPGHMKNFGTNLPLPELQLAFENVQNPRQYRRSLSLDDAIARVGFRTGDGVVERQVFASNTDRLLVIRLTCGRPGQINFRMSFGQSPLPAKVKTSGNDTLVLDGHAWEHLHSSGHDGVALQIRVHVLPEGGRSMAGEDVITVHSANAATLLVATGTSFRGGDPEAVCREAIEAARRKNFAQMRRDHIADYQALYNRVSIDLGQSASAIRNRPTDVRHAGLENGAEDPELLALFFQYGRYLTIAGSRADSQLPLALQGIWNDGLASSMGWTDDYHLDINTEQNYWAAEVCNLAECQMPLFALIEEMRKSGRRTAREMYGAPGWAVHTVTNPWGYTAPGDVGWGIFVSAGIWISLQMWDHWTFNGDIEFLRTRAYPVLREAAEFFLAYMVPEPKHGWLVTGPSDSPENWYFTPTGGRASESMGCTCDRAFVYALYTMCIEASKKLSVDADLRRQLEEAKSKLPPYQVGRHGQLQEWLEDFKEAEPNHRHTSNLVGLYPLHQISPRTTPELARAAEVTIQRRMDAPHWEQSEWGRANLVVYFARLLKGDDAHKYLVSLVTKAADANLLTFSSAGVAGATQNIFAVDGNTAGAAGIAEMLLQSQGGQIEFLPALPAAWSDGSIRGLCARGGYVIDIVWGKVKLRSATVLSRNGGAAQFRYGDRVTNIHFQPGESKLLPAEVFARTIPGSAIHQERELH
ncbi:MAG: glycoside hydrolase family 95 protein, partial [Acidobacteriaceae bacterium]